MVVGALVCVHLYVPNHSKQKTAVIGGTYLRKSSFESESPLNVQREEIARQEDTGQKGPFQGAVAGHTTVLGEDEGQGLVVLGLQWRRGSRGCMMEGTPSSEDWSWDFTMAFLP